MISRRNLLKTSATCLAVPLVLTKQNLAWGNDPKLKVRKNLMSLADNDPFFEKYGEAVKAMHALPTTDLRSWWGQATIHANYCQHGTLNFASWHRPYITLFEDICGHLIGDPSFTLHYWDWSEKNGILPNPFYDLNNLNVTYWNDPGKYDGINWGPIDSIGIRALDKGVGLQSDPARAGNFTQKNLKSILSQNKFSTFTNMLEGQPHNTGHVMVGFPAKGLAGHMGEGLSPLDPIFWMHHCMVDYMWASWQSNGNITEDKDEIYKGMFVNQDGAPVTYTSKETHDFKAMGFTYENLNFTLNSRQSLLKGVTKSDPVQKSMAAILDQQKLQTIGQTQNTITNKVNVESSLNVKIPTLLNSLQKSRVFKTSGITQTPALASEGARILAVLKNVTWPEGGSSGLVVNVFVNCPYLSPETPASDRHYAGTFSFFGSKAMMEKMGHKDHSIIIDITEPLRDQAGTGRTSDEIKVQFMPLDASFNSNNVATFKITDIEILVS